jgi:hypothetical protein
MLIPPTIRYLHQTKPVSPRVQPHCFRIDSNLPGAKRAFRQIFLMKMDGHDAPSFVLVERIVERRLCFPFALATKKLQVAFLIIWGKTHE